MSESCPLSGVKQTSQNERVMSANDPKQTCRHAKQLSGIGGSRACGQFGISTALVEVIPFAFPYVGT